MLLHSAFPSRCVAWPRPTGCTAEDMPGTVCHAHHPGPEGAAGPVQPEKATGAPELKMGVCSCPGPKGPSSRLLLGCPKLQK